MNQSSFTCLISYANPQIANKAIKLFTTWKLDLTPHVKEIRETLTKIYEKQVNQFPNCNNDLLPVCRPRGTSLQVCLQKKRGHYLPESWRRNLSIQSRYIYPYLRRLMPVIIVTLSQFLIFFYIGCVASAQSRVKWQTSVCASSFVHGQPQVSSLFDIEQRILSYNHYHYHLFCMVNAK